MRRWVEALAMVVCGALASCTHELRVVNSGDYENRSLLSLERGIQVGIVPSTTNVHEERLMKEIANQLGKYGADALLPYSENSRRSVDVIANISLTSEHSGSGWNFPIEFPGFLIWMPAWHGFHYHNHYGVSILLKDAKTRTPIDSFHIPIDLRIRHADINRTWTEISWFEVGAIAFFSGFVFIGYDKQVTGLTLDRIGPQVGDYIAQDIVRRIDAFGLVPVTAR